MRVPGLTLLEPQSQSQPNQLPEEYIVKRILALVAFTVLGTGCVLPLAPTAPTNGPAPVAGPVVPARPADEDIVIGWTPLGTEIKAQRYGTGPNVVLFVGGIHGNEKAPKVITDAAAAFPWDGSTTVWVIPAINPDGVNAGRRLTSQGWDLNREGRWQRALEVKVLTNFIAVYRPQLTLEIHAPSNYVGVWGGGLTSQIANSYQQRTNSGNRGTITNCGGAPDCLHHSYGGPTILFEVPSIDSSDCSGCWDKRQQTNIADVHWRGWVMMEEVDGWM